MKVALIFALFLTLACSESNCEMVYGSTFNTTFSRSSISNYCFTVLDSIFLGCMSESSGGAISIHCSNSYGIVHECTFVNCQSKAQGGCIYFSGTSFETFRCCAINCSTRYSSMFMKTEIGGTGPRNTLADMITIASSSSQFNALSTKNGDATYTNINLTKSRSSATVLAIELTGLDNAEVGYFTFQNNRGDYKGNTIFNVFNDISESVKLIHHGNFIKNTCANGGVLFTFASEGEISDCIFQDNSRSILTALRYYVTFISCVFDGAETKTEFQTVKNCQFLTETSTWQFTMMDCNDYKLKLGLENKRNYTVQFKSIGYVASVVGIVCLLATIIFLFVKAKKSGNDEDENLESERNENEDAISATPLIQH